MNVPNTLRKLAAALALATGAGCAFHYHDKATGTEHVWGVGHLKMRAGIRTDAPAVVVHSVQTLGLALGLDDSRRGLTFGWTDAQTARVLAEPAALTLSYPARSLLELEVTRFPPGGENPLPPR